MVPVGCGGMLDCGVCTGTDVCGAMATNKCGLGVCNPTTCTALGFNCGIFAFEQIDTWKQLWVLLGNFFVLPWMLV